MDELIRRGAKMVVVACNTASGAALETLRELFPIPIVGLEPAVKPATQRTRNGRVGVLATEGTLRSARFGRLVEKYGGGAEVVVSDATIERWSLAKAPTSVIQTSAPGGARPIRSSVVWAVSACVPQ